MSIDSITKKLKKMKISNNDMDDLIKKMKKLNIKELTDFEMILKKRGKRNQNGGNNNIKIFNMYGKKIKVISVAHDVQLINSIFQTLFTENTVFFLEESINLNKTQFINKLKKGEIYEETTKKILWKLIIGKYENKFIGWDVRPTILKGQDQTGLYGQDKSGMPFFILQTKNEIINRYIKPINGYKNSKYQEFLNQQVPDMNYLSLMKQGYVKQNLIDTVLYNLREDYKNLSDDYIVKELLPKYKDQNINIIVGSQHYNSLNEKIFNEIQKKKLFHQMMGLLTDIQES
jgi:hypothetical protein